ncbi:MAG: extracellular solute-binding protein [Ignavibacteriales bacterium]|nr:MAG: extracellular solute-binding protein [Ignavibacteriales bacterium]
MESKKLNRLKKYAPFIEVAAFLCLLVVYLGVFPFIKEEEQKATEIYFADRMSSAHLSLINSFNKKHEGKIKVVPVDFPNQNFSTNERKELLARSLRGRGDGIDLIGVDIIWVQRFAKWCEPISKYFNKSDIENFIEPVLKSCYYEGELYAVPFDLVEGVLYYRKDIIQKAKDGDKIIEKLKQGITWDEFIDIGKQLNKPNPYYIFPADNYEGLVCSYVELLLGLDDKYFEKNNFNLNTSNSEKALQLLVDFVNKYNLTPKVVTDFTEIPSYGYFIENDGIFLRGWPTYDKDFINTSLQSEKADLLEKAPLPYFEEGKPSAVLGGMNLMVSKFSNKKDEVLTFLKFLISEEAQELILKEAGYFPIIKTFYEDSVYLKKYPELIEYKELLKHGVLRPAHEDYTRYSEIMSHYFKQAIMGRMQVKDALEMATNAMLTKQFVFPN